jgi:hypothetical protein
MNIATFRKLIREEVAKALRAELPTILNEAISTPAKQVAPKRSSINDLMEGRPEKHTDFQATGNPMLDLLNETRVQMTTQNEEWPSMGNYDSSAINSYRSEMMGAFGGGAAPTVQSVDQMVQTARPAQDVSQVQINAVPDFSKMMGALKDKGKL